MLPTVTIELTSAKLPAISWFVPVIASSRTVTGHWFYTSRVLLRAGTFRAPMSMSPLLPSRNIKHFVPTKVCAAITTSAMHTLRPGRIAKPILKLVAFPTSFRLNRTLFRSLWMARNSALSLGKPSFRTAPTANSALPR